jgi:hypothetical protein
VALAEIEARDTTRREQEKAEWWVDLLDALLDLPDRSGRW